MLAVKVKFAMILLPLFLHIAAGGLGFLKDAAGTFGYFEEQVKGNIPSRWLKPMPIYRARVIDWALQVQTSVANVETEVFYYDRWHDIIYLERSADVQDPLRSQGGHSYETYIAVTNMDTAGCIRYEGGEDPTIDLKFCEYLLPWPLMTSPARLQRLEMPDLVESDPRNFTLDLSQTPLQFDKLEKITTAKRRLAEEIKIFNLTREFGHYFFGTPSNTPTIFKRLVDVHSPKLECLPPVAPGKRWWVLGRETPLTDYTPDTLNCNYHWPEGAYPGNETDTLWDPNRKWATVPDRKPNQKNP